MRERLVVAFVGLTLAVIALYGIPRAYFLADLVREAQQEELEGTAYLLDGLVAERLDAGGSVDRELLQRGLVTADRVTWVTEDGTALRVGAGAGAGTGTGAESGAESGAGSDAEPEDDGVSVERVVDDAGTLELSVSAESIGRSVRNAVTPLVVVGVGLAALSALLGFVISRRMARPFSELAELSRDLGHGDFDLRIPHYAVPEAEAIGSSLRTTAAQLDNLVRREREFAANASHQLRTPITALRLGLEDLTYWPEVEGAPGVRAELERGLGELDRLSAAIDELLELARGRQLDAQAEVDLARVVQLNAERWNRRLVVDDRDLAVFADGPVLTRVPVGAVEQILDVLVENARVHGEGEITLTTVDTGSRLEISVADEGTRRIGIDVFRRGVSTRHADGPGHGIGLAVAAELAEVCGGHLSLDTESPTTRFVLWLPKRDATDAGTASAE